MTRSRIVTAMLVGGLAIGLIAAGCGDDDDGDEAASLTKEEWIAQADEICAQGNEEIGQQAGEVFGGGPPSAAEERRFAEEVVVPNIEEQVADVKALSPPEGDEEQVDAIIAAAEEGLAQAEENPLAINEDALDEATQLMAEYGSKVCGGGDEE
jgi:hypothetical protein